MKTNQPKLKTRLIVLVLLPFIANLVANAQTDSLFTINTCNEQGKCVLELHSEPVKYIKDGKVELIDSRIETSTDPLYNYQVVKGFYLAYFKSNPTHGDTVRFVKEGKSISFQPMALSYRNALNQIQQVNTVQPVTGVTSNNEFTYPNAYGNGISIKYTYQPTELKERLVIDSKSSLPLPQSYIISGGQATLDLDFIMTTDNRIFIQGTEWDKASTVSTSQEVQVRDAYGNNIYTLSRPVAYDAKGQEIPLAYELKKSSNKLYITIKTPYAWLNSSDTYYPIVIDPTVVFSIPGNTVLEDTFISQGSPSDNYGDLSLSMYRYYSGSEWNNDVALKFRSNLTLANYNVTNANVCLKVKQNTYDDGSEGFGAAAYLIDNSYTWTEYTMTWNNKPSDTALYNASNTVDFRGTNVVVNSNKCWVVTDAVNYAVKSQYQNISFLIRTVTRYDSPAASDSILFYSKSEASADITLTVTYDILNIPPVSTISQNLSILYGNENAQIKVYATDAENDSMSINTLWYVNSILAYNETRNGVVTGSNNTFQLSPSNFSKGDTVYANVTVYDTTSSSPVLKTNTQTVLYECTIPGSGNYLEDCVVINMEQVTIPDNYIIENASTDCVVKTIYNTPTIGLNYTWHKNESVVSYGTYLGAQSDTWVVLPRFNTSTNAGDNVTCKVKAYYSESAEEKNDTVPVYSAYRHFTAKNILANVTITEFTLTYAGIDYTTTTGVANVPVSELGVGDYNVVVSAPGYTNLNTTITYHDYQTSTIQANMTRATINVFFSESIDSLIQHTDCLKINDCQSFNTTNITMNASDLSSGRITINFNKDVNGNWEQVYVFNNDQITTINITLLVETVDVQQDVVVTGLSKSIEGARVCSYRLNNAKAWVITYCDYTDQSGTANLLLNDQNTYKLCAEYQGYEDTCLMENILPSSSSTYTIDLVPIGIQDGRVYVEPSCRPVYSEPKNCTLTVTGYVQQDMCIRLYRNGLFNSETCVSKMANAFNYNLNTVFANTTVSLLVENQEVFRIYHKYQVEDPSSNINWDLPDKNGQTFNDKVSSDSRYLITFYIIMFILGVLSGWMTEKYFNGYGAYGSGAFFTVIGITVSPLFLVGALPMVAHFIIKTMLPLVK